MSTATCGTNMGVVLGAVSVGRLRAMSGFLRTLLELGNCTLNRRTVAREPCITALPPRFRRHQVDRAVVDDQLAKVFGAVLDGGDPDIGIVDHMLPGFPSKWRRCVHAGI